MERLTWRVIPQERYSAYANMAIDEAIAEAVGSGRSPPTIRFYGWPESGAISLSVVQDQNDVDLQASARNGIEVVRRSTGGRALYHGKTDLTYSVAAPSYAFADKNEFINTVVEWLTYAVNAFGIKNVEWNGKTSLFVDGKKLSGNAQRLSLRGGYYFQHGSIFVDLDYRLLAEIYGIDEHIVRENTTALHELIGEAMSIKKDISAVFQEAFTSGRQKKQGKLSGWEKERAKELIRTKYGTREWDERGKRSKGHCSTQWTKDPPSRLVKPIKPV